MASRKTVKLFFDVVSPYSWFGFEALTRYRSRWAMDLIYKPVFLGGIMVGSDNKPPGTNPAKGQYMMLHDLPHLAKHYNLPVNPPSNPAESVFSPGASLPAMRFLTALSIRQPDKVEDMARQLWLRLWSQDKPINKPQNLIEAGKAAGIDDATLQQLVTSLSSQEVKDKLKEVTQEALDLGAFGAPFYVTEDAAGETHVFFGSDRVHVLADVLGEKYVGPLNELNKAKL